MFVETGQLPQEQLTNKWIDPRKVRVEVIPSPESFFSTYKYYIFTLLLLFAGKTHQLVIDWLQKFRPDSSSEEREAIYTGLVKKTNISYEKYQLSDKFINEFKSNYSQKGIKAPSDVYSDYKNHKRWRKHHLIQIDRIRNILLNMKNQINEK